MGLIVHLNGYPGTGKLTIARALAQRLNARVLDNHTLMNPAAALFARDDTKYPPFRAAIRKLVFDHALSLPQDTQLIVTDAFSDGPADRQMFDEIKTLAARRNDVYRPVVLEVEGAENIARLTSPERDGMKKLTDATILTRLRDEHRLYYPADCLTLDVSLLQPDQAAARIADWLASGAD